MTGASGTVYGSRLLEVIAANFPELRCDVVVTDAALRVMAEEEGKEVKKNSLSFLSIPEKNNFNLHSNKDIGANIASGSYRTSGMVVVPCSMNTLASIATGQGDSLLCRAADVVQKERRKLIIVPRETPLSQIHLENLLRLSQMGATIIPAMPGFYHQPSSILELVDSVVMRILDHMDLDTSLVKRWKSDS